MRGWQVVGRQGMMTLVPDLRGMVTVTAAMTLVVVSDTKSVVGSWAVMASGMCVWT